jgi:nitrogen fixation protein
MKRQKHKESNSIYPIVDRFVREAVLQIERIDDHGLSQFEPVTDPEEGAIEVHEHPLVGIHVEGGGELQTRHQEECVCLCVRE